MKVDIINIQGESTGKSIELPASIFGVEPNEHAVYLAVKQHLANKRRGTHKAKERNEIAGSTRKLKKQKGTGTARFGDIKNPLFRGGGRVFGPKPRTYDQKLNKKVKRLARLSALSAKAANGSVLVVEDFTFDSPKTKQFQEILNNLQASGKALMVTNEYDQSLFLSSRNLKNSQVVNAKDLNTYAVVNADKVIFVESAIQVLNETFA